MYKHKFYNVINGRHKFVYMDFYDMPNQSHLPAQRYVYMYSMNIQD
jgi:hypothetical protein